MVSTGRTASYWLLVASLGLALARQVHAEPEKKPNPQSAQQQANPSEPTKQAVAPKTPVDRPSVYKRECGRPRDAQEDALCVSVQAAIAAEKSAKLANDQLTMGWLQVVGLLISLGFTGWAAWAAADAAKAAKASVEDARADATEQAERFERQFEIAKQNADAAKLAAEAASAQSTIAMSAQRAYFVAFSHLVVANGALDLWIKNVGLTPGTCTGYAVDLFPQLPHTPPGFEGWWAYNADWSVPAGDPVKFGSLALADDAAGHVLGFLIYRDVFGPERITRFRYDKTEAGWHLAGGEMWNSMT